MEYQVRVRSDLAAELAARYGRDPQTDAWPRLAAGMALLALDQVLQQWQPGDDEHRLARLTDAAFAVLAPALDAAAPTPGRPVQRTG
jgi:hypothetical protein